MPEVTLIGAVRGLVSEGERIADLINKKYLERSIAT